MPTNYVPVHLEQNLSCAELEIAKPVSKLSRFVLLQTTTYWFRGLNQMSHVRSQNLGFSVSSTYIHVSIIARFYCRKTVEENSGVSPIDCMPDIYQVLFQEMTWIWISWNLSNLCDHLILSRQWRIWKILFTFVTTSMPSDRCKTRNVMSSRTRRQVNWSLIETSIWLKARARRDLLSSPTSSDL